MTDWNDIYICNGIYNDVTDQDFIDFFANDVVQRMVMTGKKEEIEEIIKKMPSIPLPTKCFITSEIFNSPMWGTNGE